jgi:hypothetical protein
VSRTDHQSPFGSQRNPARWIPLVVLPLLALLPPETRGESMAATALLIAVLSLCAWRAGAWTGEQLAVVIAAVLVIPSARFALAPGAAVLPSALVLVAAGAGLSVAALNRSGAVGVRDRFDLAAGEILGGAGALVSVHAIYQLLWGMQRQAALVANDAALPDREALLVRLEQGRAFAAFSTPAALGGFVALAIPVTAVLAVRTRGGQRLVWAAALMLQLGGLLSAASATATAALFGALFLAALFRRERGRTVWAAVVIALALVASVVLLRGPEVLGASHPNSPWRLRAGNYRAAWSMALDHPWTGVGPGGFAESYPAYRKPGDNETRHVHNLPLELCSELGIPVGVAVSALFFVVFLAPLVRAGNEADPRRRAVAAGLAAFALQNMADFTAFLPSLLWTASLLRGSLARARAPAGPRAVGTPARALAGASLVVVLGSALLAALGGVADNARMGSRFAAYRGEPEHAERLARRSSFLAPWDPSAALLFARAATLDPPLEQAGTRRREEALERANRAVRLSPVRPAAREVRARVRLAAGDYPGAYADMLAASRLYPRNAEYARARDRLEALTRDAIDRGGDGP